MRSTAELAYPAPIALSIFSPCVGEEIRDALDALHGPLELVVLPLQERYQVDGPFRLLGVVLGPSEEDEELDNLPPSRDDVLDDGPLTIHV